MVRGYRLGANRRELRQADPFTGNSVAYGGALSLTNLQKQSDSVAHELIHGPAALFGNRLATRTLRFAGMAEARRRTAPQNIRVSPR
jgi:hypothetical protein